MEEIDIEENNNDYKFGVPRSGAFGDDTEGFDFDQVLGTRPSFIVNPSKSQKHQDSKNSVNTIDENDIALSMEGMKLEEEGNQDLDQDFEKQEGEEIKGNFDFKVVGNKINVGRHSMILKSLIESGAVTDVSHILEESSKKNINIPDSQSGSVKSRFMENTCSSIFKKSDQQNENVAPTVVSAVPKVFAATKTVPFKFHSSRERVTDKGVENIQKRIEGNKQLLQKNYIKALNSVPFKTTLSEKRPTVPQPFNFNKLNREKEPENIIKTQAPVVAKKVDAQTKVTKPVAFQFAVDKRAEQKKSAAEAPVPSKSTFVAKPVVKSVAATIRPKSAPLRLTKPIEFSFASDNRAKTRVHAAPVSQSYKTTAQSIKEFQSKTPLRFHTKSRIVKEFPKPMAKLQVTEPVTVKFATSARRRPTIELSSEDKEIEYIRNHGSFKAKPVNEKIFNSSGDLGVPRIRKRPITAPVAPKFVTDERLGVKRVEPVIKVEEPVKKSGPLTITRPYSPKLMTRERASLKPEPLPEPEEPLPPPFVALPLPDFTKKNEAPHLPKSSLTSPKPFKLMTEVRGLVSKEKFEAQVEAELQQSNEARQFKANPIVYNDNFGVAHVLTKKLCSPAPFKLQSVERSLQARKLFEDKLSYELAQAAEARNFRARHLPQSHSHYDAPQIKPAPVTSPDMVVLKSDIRARQRSEFDSILAEKEQQAQLRRAAELREKSERDAIELKSYRKSLDFHAIPIMKMNPVTVERSEKELTSPHTPWLRTKQRAVEKEEETQN